ncbi:hypothetical protein E2C01_094906 [Portunus trituberculatus]|uniref:Uncharacterized protein n=1 Tax=Portunus trituberculatus TaxID=210409 RepID=A0A5B7JRQ3_PORTR|nr:hypothetical protein [Portunus trituberculatus]
MAPTFLVVKLWRQWSRGSLSPHNGHSYPRLLMVWLPQLGASGLRARLHWERESGRERARAGEFEWLH